MSDTKSKTDIEAAIAADKPLDADIKEVLLGALNFVPDEVLAKLMASSSEERVQDAAAHKALIARLATAEAALTVANDGYTAAIAALNEARNERDAAVAGLLELSR